MLAGLIVFVLGKTLRGAGEAPAPLPKNREWTLYGVGLAAVAVIWALIQYQDVSRPCCDLRHRCCSATSCSRPCSVMPYGGAGARRHPASSGRCSAGWLHASSISSRSWLGLPTSEPVLGVPHFGDISVAGRARRARRALVALRRGRRKARRRASSARPDLRDPVPDRAEPGLLGPVRAGGRQHQPLHRPLRRLGRRARADLPVDQPDLHPAARAALRGPLAVAGQARARAFGAGQVRPRPAPGRRRLPVFVWGANAFPVGAGDDRRSSSSSCSICLQRPASSACPRSG